MNLRRLLPLFSILIGGFLLITLACVSTANPGSTPEITGSPPPTPVTPPSWYAVYFTDPSGSNSQTLLSGPDRDLASAIEAARVSVDIAVLHLNLWSIRNSLIDAYHRGVSVRVVVDSDYLDEDEIRDLIEAGIPILGDRSGGTMHNKFAVIDRKQIWTGSMNYTVSDTYWSHNNLLRIDSPELAENYTSEFEEMFLDDRFGIGSPANTPHPVVKIQGVSIENCFAPDDGCQTLLTDLIKSARKSIQFLAFSFTSDNLASAMLERAEAGVSVSGVFDKGQYYSNRGTVFDKLRSANLDVYLNGDSYNMHNKVIIIDDRIVVTGSYNFTYFAENRNDENVLIIHSPEIAGLYQIEFLDLFDQSQ